MGESMEAMDDGDRPADVRDEASAPDGDAGAAGTGHAEGEDAAGAAADPASDLTGEDEARVAVSRKARRRARRAPKGDATRPGKARHRLRGRWGRVVALGAALAVGAGVLASTDGPGADSAEALTPPLTMTAEDLPTWQTNGIVWALAESNGVIYAGGTFSTIRPPGAASGTQEQPADNFVALDAATGEPVADCDLDFTVGSGTATIRALAVSPDGQTLYAGGTFGSVNGQGASSVAAFDIPSCTRKPFPVAANGIVRAIAATNDRVYLGGDFTQLSGVSRSYFGAVNASDGAVTTWRADADEVGKAIAITPDGQNVVLGGDFFRMNGANSHALAVVRASTGANVRTYPTGFIHENSTVQSLAVDDTSFYTGNEGSGGGVFDGRIALNLSDFNERWRDTCLGATQAVAVHEDVLYSGHHAHDCSSMGEFPNQPRYHLFGQSVGDGAKLGWFPNTNDGLGESVGPRVIAVAEDVPGEERDFLWVGGGFTTVNGQPQWGLTRFATGPDTGNPSTPETYASSLDAGQIDVTWRPSQDLDDSELTYRVYRDGGATPVHTVSASSMPWSRPQLVYEDTDVTAGETHSYRVTATDAAGNTSALSAPVTATVTTGGEPYADAVRADNPLLYWRYNETANNFAADASGHNASGAHRGGPQRGVSPGAVPGPDARGIGYDGTDSYTYSERRYSGLTRFTAETWFQTTTNQGGRLLGFGNRILEDSTNRDNNIYMRNDGRLVFGVYNSSNTRWTITSSQSYNDGDWHHVAASVGASGMRLYVDGQQVASNVLITSARNTTGWWRSGGDSLFGWSSRPSSDYFSGRMDETAVYNVQLSASRIAAHYQAASAPTDTVTAVEPTADTYVNGASTGSNYGSHAQLAVRGSSAYESYLAFDVPAAPSGQTLLAASLQLTVTGDSFAGSADSFDVREITGSWSEDTTTYATRPTLDDGVIGTLAAPDSPGSVQTVPLDLATLEGALGGSVDLALTSAGTDSLWLWSGEANNAGYRPQLVLTFGAP
ncbi:LamG-like jellyroll fold domain-containing protein [Streptomyces sp. DSM 44917]|uniref:LamG-like jellyroll fold domain-containing protein n=1 Tax=Streptomyces boetiae TaxID=3075541 RepID=A0ABU2L3X5_9ACTN|nr:LamG-like jellyroll fold domain-containing protein [Streptomyces sp. DSM 44917]MDT0306225.1 LamG-like jellyroll fold domain-containing protein [Streptomyces sp. DSM 44917]